MNANATVSRRHFMRVAGIAAASTAAGASAAPSTELKAAIIGHTGAGDYGHGIDLIFKELPGVRVVGIADKSESGRAKAKSRIGAARAYADFVEMIRVEKPNLVAVAPRWADEHFAMVKAALNAGTHVFCEKPFTVSLRESDELLALAAKKRLRIAVAHQMRLAPGIVALRRKIAEGFLGDLVQMRAFGKQDSRAGGEDMLVLGVHHFDLMRLFAGDARRCSATVWSRGRLANLADRKMATEGVGYVLGEEIEAQFEFDRGVLGTFTSRARLRPTIVHSRLELIGTKGSAMILAGIEPRVLILKTGTFEAHGRRDEWTPFTFTGDGQSGTTAANRRLALDWLAAVEQQREPACSGANAAKAIEMVMAVYQAHLSGRRIDLPLENRENALG